MAPNRGPDAIEAIDTLKAALNGSVPARTLIEVHRELLALLEWVDQELVSGRFPADD